MRTSLSGSDPSSTGADSSSGDRDPSACASDPPTGSCDPSAGNGDASQYASTFSTSSLMVSLILFWMASSSNPDICGYSMLYFISPSVPLWNTADISYPLSSSDSRIFSSSPSSAASSLSSSFWAVPVFLCAVTLISSVDMTKPLGALLKGLPSTDPRVSRNSGYFLIFSSRSAVNSSSYSLVPSYKYKVI